MTPTGNDLRNAIRDATGRFDHEGEASFTDEELAAIADEVGYAVDAGDPPSTARMRAGIRREVGLREDDDPDAGGGEFRKAELRTIATAVGVTDDHGLL